jgi:hypothetical protein
MRRLLVFFVAAMLLLLLLNRLACRPQKLERGRVIAEEVEMRTVKRFTQKQILAETVRVGDSLTRLADSLALLRLPTALRQGGIGEALKHYPPEAYPQVQALARHYGARPARQRSSGPAVAKGSQVRQLNNTELLYTKPIYLTQTCLPCHGQAITGADARVLQEQKPLWARRGLQEGDLAGIWYIPVQRKAILDGLTLRDMKKRPGRN